MSCGAMERCSWTSIGHTSVWNEFVDNYPLNVLLPENGAFCFTNKTGFHKKEPNEEAVELFRDAVVSVCFSQTTMHLCSRDGKVQSYSMDTIWPLQNQIPSTLKVAQVACGNEHLLLRTREGALFVKGKGPQNGLKKDIVSAPEPLLNNVDFIAAGEEHSLAIVTHEIQKGQERKITRTCSSMTPEILKRADQELLETNFPDVTNHWGAQIIQNLLNTKRLDCGRVRGPLDSSQSFSEADDEGVFLSTNTSKLPDIDTRVLVWGRGAGYRLGLQKEKDFSEPQEVKELTRQGAVIAACGKTHCAVATTSGRLFIWGTAFEDQPPLKSPQIVDVNRSDSILSIEAGDCITVVAINRKDDGPNLCRVHSEKKGPCPVLEDIKVQPEMRLQTCVVKKNDCFAFYRSSDDWTQTTKLYNLCHTWSQKVSLIHPLPDRHAVKDLSTLYSTFAKLNTLSTILRRTTLALVSFLTLRTLRLPPLELVEPALLKILDEELQALEAFWKAAHIFDAFNGFEMLEKRMDPPATLRSNFMDQSPELDELKELISDLEHLSKDDKEFTFFTQRITQTKRIISECAADYNLKKIMMEFLPKKIALVLLETEPLFKLITPNHFKEVKQMPDKLKPLYSPIEISGTEGAIKWDKAMLCLGPTNLVIVQGNRRNDFEGISWPMNAVWIHSDKESDCKLNILLPDLILTLTAKNPEGLRIWKFALVDAINRSFDNNPARLSDARKWEKRRMSYEFRFGNFAGFTYDGEWCKAEMEGVGELKGIKRDSWSYKYYGEFHCNQRHGLGIQCRTHRNTPLMSELSSGRWVEDRLDGFGIIEEIKQRSMSLSSSGRHNTLVHPLYVGNFSKNEKSGFGFENASDGDKYVGMWKNNMKHGPAIILTYKGHHQDSLVDCEFEFNKIKCVSGKVNDSNFRYEGQLDEEKMPKGEGKIYYNIAPNCGLVIKGDVSLSKDACDGKILVRKATITSEKVRAEDHDFAFLPETAADSTNWQNLMDMCVASFLPSNPEIQNGQTQAIWKKIGRFLCKESSEWSPKDIDYFAEISDRSPHELSSEDFQKMTAVMKTLCKQVESPIAAFLRVRLELMTFPTGVQLLDLSRLQDLVLHDLKSVLIDLYAMSRLLFPGLPKNWKADVCLKDSLHDFKALHFALSFLPDDSNAFHVLADVLDKHCYDTDRAFVQTLDELKALDDEAILKLMGIADKKFMAALVRCVKHEDEKNMELLRECIKKVKECFDGKAYNYTDAIKVLLGLDIFHRALETFLESINFGKIGADDLWPFLYFLVVKAETKKLLYCINFVEKLTIHYRQNIHTAYLTSLFATYCANAKRRP